MAQTVKQFNGIFNVRFYQVNSTNDLVIAGDYVDQGGEGYTYTDLKSGDQIIDAKGDAFEILSVSYNFNYSGTTYPVYTTVKALNKANPTIGLGTAFRPTTRNFPLIATNASPSLTTKTLNSSIVKIDQAIPKYGTGLSLPIVTTADGDIVISSLDSKPYIYNNGNWEEVTAITSKFAASLPGTVDPKGTVIKLLLAPGGPIYYSNGSAWVIPPVVSSFAVKPKYGDIFYVSGEGKLYMYDGNDKWTVLGGGPVPLPLPPSTGDAKPGEIYYDTAAHRIYVFNGMAWVPMDNSLEDGKFYVGNSDNIAVATDKQAISLNGFGLGDNHILVGNASGTATEVLMSGDVTLDNTGKATIADGSISLAKFKTDPATDKNKVYAIDENGIAVLVDKQSIAGKIPGGASNPVSADAGDLFYNLTEKVLYVYDGSHWVSVDALGSTPSGPANPATSDAKVGDLFYNLTDKVFYVFDGSKWLPINQAGTPPSGPSNPVDAKSGDLFYNLTEKVLYVYDGTKWIPVNQAGTSPSGPINPADAKSGDLFYNLTEKVLYVYDGSQWVPVDAVGSTPNGAVNPVVAKVGDLFYNITDKVLYVYNGSQWVPVDAVGSMPSGSSNPPVGNAKVGDLFYNLTEQVFYVFDGSKWLPVNQAGSSPSGPSNPSSGAKTGDLFFNSTDKMLYFYDGSQWVPVHQAEASPSGPTNPADAKAGDLFYNLTDKVLYVFDGSKWIPVNEAGTSPSGPTNPTDAKRGE
ncbi:MAG TPA: hypothetical protein VEV15_05235, partial [Flavisolibacter sp.]|nr:hypothetical protein [Flavisolibacter sp.]